MRKGLLRKVRIGEDTQEIDLADLTLDEQWWLERDFGVNVLAPEEISPVRWLIGVVAIALKRANPELTEAEAKDLAGVRPSSQIEVSEVKPERPTRAGARKGGAPAKTRKVPGDQSSPVSTD